MLERIKKIPRRAGNLIGRTSFPDARPTLKDLGKGLRSESKNSLEILACRSADLHPVHELHIAIDNLTNTDAAVRQVYRSKDWVGAEPALSVIDAEMIRTANLLYNCVISKSVDAAAITQRTLNLLFNAKQSIKQEFGLITALDVVIPKESPDFPKQLEPGDVSAPYTFSKIVLSAAMIFQLRLSLFPAERMLVGAARKMDRNIRIEALFDVTGEDNPSGVKADPNRLGQALIAMAETGTYFGMWIHSHPGTGPGATHPSSIDVRQHADWLKDYSPDLVSAIMVRDRYIRFWGTAVEAGDVAVAIEGGGIDTVSEAERIYRLAS